MLAVVKQLEMSGTILKLNKYFQDNQILLFFMHVHVALDNKNQRYLNIK